MIQTVLAKTNTKENRTKQNKINYYPYLCVMEKITRDQIQGAAIAAVRDKKRVILNWGTGVGKSRVAVLSSQWLVNEYKTPKILLVVQETAHKSNWQNEFIEALGEEEAAKVLDRITIDCYASLKNHVNTIWDYIVFDEGHHLRSEQRREIFTTIRAERVLLLSATISDGGDGDDMLADLDTTFGEFVTYEFKMQKAIDNGFLGTPEIHVIPVVLSPDQTKEYQNLDQYQKDRKKAYFQARYEAGLQFNDKRETALTDQLKSKWLNSGSRKKRFLGYKKTTVAKKLINRTLKDTRYVCFCASVKQVEWLNGKNYICSKRTAKENKEAIEAFNELKEDSLYTVGMLQEGQNLNQIQKGLIIQLDGKERSFVQKFGRVMRAKVPVLYILYVVDTRDEEYLKTALSGINKEYINTWNPVYTDGSKAPALIPKQEQPQPVTQTVSVPPAIPMRLPRLGADVRINYLFGISHQNTRFTWRNQFLLDTCCGYFAGVAETQEEIPRYVFAFKDLYRNEFFGIVVNKKQSLGFLAPLSGLNLFNQPITIRLTPKNGFAEVSLFLGQSKIQWPKNFMSLVPADQDERIRLLDALALKATLHCCG